MYESPIKIIESAIDSFSKSLIKEKEDAIILEVQRSLGVDVDRGELLQALQYDRFQYDKGYADAMASIVRCKDCKGWCSEEIAKQYGVDRYCTMTMMPTNADDFCSYGERRTDNERKAD